MVHTTHHHRLPGRVPAARLLVTLAVAAGYAPRAGAVPVTYTLTVRRAPGASGVSPSGKLGAVAFGGSHGDAVVVFRLQGDTRTLAAVSKPSAPIDGVENLVGLASVEVRHAATGKVLARGTFLNSAGIFVSADHTNGGIGFGSQGAPPGSAGFPGNAAYPYGLANLSPAVGLSLHKDAKVTGAFVTSCVGFPAPDVSSCGAPLALYTTAGDLLLDATLGDGTQIGTFTVRRGR